MADRSAPLPLLATHASILKWVAGRGREAERSTNKRYSGEE